MADTRFFKVAGPFSLADIATLSGAAIRGPGDPGLILTDVKPLEVAGSTDLSFLSNNRYLDVFRTTRAGAVFVSDKIAADAPADLVLLVAPDPYLAFARAARAFYPVSSGRLVADRSGEDHSSGDTASVAATAAVDPTAQLGSNVTIGHHAVIGAGVHIGDGSSIGANTVIEDGVVMGTACRIGSNVSLSHCILGDRVTIYPGARIGQDGFGFATDANGSHLKIPQLGRVLIGNDVEIGANTTVDRGAGPDTIIGDGCMIDNLVQIGHNVVLGRGCVLAAQTGISGSTKLGDFVMAGGQVGLAGHLTVGSGARIGAKSGVMRDIPARATMGGIPAVTMTQWLRQIAFLERQTRRKDK